MKSAQKHRTISKPVTKAGFTLIELLVVIGMIASLAVAALSIF